MLLIFIRTIICQLYKNGCYQYNTQLMSDNHLFHLYSVVNTSFLSTAIPSTVKQIPISVGFLVQLYRLCLSNDYTHGQQVVLYTLNSKK